MTELLFVKLGGSVITDKSEPSTARLATIERLAGEIVLGLDARPELRLVLGHGSGSFGHVVAQQYGTRSGVTGYRAWRGFAKVAAAAAQLNRIVADTLLAAGVPVWSLQPSASAQCRHGELQSLRWRPMQEALAHGLVPLVYGDVALDESRGGTIISTEQIFAFLARKLRPARLILVSAVDGVFEGDPLEEDGGRRIPEISPDNWSALRAKVGGSHAPDVTGGMLSKVEEMLNLVVAMPDLTVHILSGHRPGALEDAIKVAPGADSGTRIRLAQRP